TYYNVSLSDIASILIFISSNAQIRSNQSRLKQNIHMNMIYDLQERCFSMPTRAGACINSGA
ncbi:MAG: hypothetical protein MJE68_00905, partial [Proteobacteria bacterium]|nr:hypothetical protein [Pseudomonadota bacterium]